MAVKGASWKAPTGINRSERASWPTDRMYKCVYHLSAGKKSWPDTSFSANMLHYATPLIFLVWRRGPCQQCTYLTEMQWSTAHGLGARQVSEGCPRSTSGSLLHGEADIMSLTRGVSQWDLGPVNISRLHDALGLHWYHGFNSALMEQSLLAKSTFLVVE